MTMDNLALSVDGLSVHLGGVMVLRAINLHVDRGSTVGLLGRNGSGKTTTLRAVMGLVPASAGVVILLGNEVEREPAHWRARLGVGYAPEDRRMISSLTVEDNLWLPANACGLSCREAEERLKKIEDILPELGPLRKRGAASLSGGQQKIVALGRALMVGQELLLLDEPFQGLAPALARRYAEALCELRERDRHVAILISESNPSLLTRIVQKTYTIERGEIVDIA